MILYFIRHGQSANNALYDATGSDLARVSDPELTPAGEAQAGCVAQELSSGYPLDRPHAGEEIGFGITHLYCSLMTRAVHTGQIIAESLYLPLEGWTDLHEGGGIYLEDPLTGARTGYPGATRGELEARFPDLGWPADAAEGGWWNRPYEEHAERPARARRVLAGLLARHAGTDDRVAFVSHGGFYFRFMCAVLNLPDPPGLWFSLYNTAISCIEFTPHEHLGPSGRIHVRYLNRVSHLPDGLIT